jgi:hypothetical protein
MNEPDTEPSTHCLQRSAVPVGLALIEGQSRQADSDGRQDAVVRGTNVPPASFALSHAAPCTSQRISSSVALLLRQLPSGGKGTVLKVGSGAQNVCCSLAEVAHEKRSTSPTTFLSR